MNEELHVYENDVTEWFVARDVVDAIELAKALYRENGYVADEESERLLDFTQTPDEKVIGIWWDIARDQPDDGGLGNLVKRTPPHGRHLADAGSSARRNSKGDVA